MQAVQLEMFNETAEQKIQSEFLSILFHDAAARNGFFLRTSFRPDIITSWTKEVRNLRTLTATNDTYIAINSFRKKNRDSVFVHTVNSLFFDLDWHESDDLSEISERVQNTLKTLKKASEDDVLPYPTMITKTGRGLGLFYVLDKSIANTQNTQKQIKYWEYVYRNLAKTFVEVLNESEAAGVPVLDFDNKVVADKSRVCRLPATINTKTGTTCELFEVFRKAKKPVFYSLNKLANYITIEPSEDLPKVSQRSENSNVVDFHAFRTSPMLWRRLEKLRRAQNVLRQNIGTRELLCFYYYNTACQLYTPLEAHQMLLSYNDRFAEPIDNYELVNIIRSVSSAKDLKGDVKGYYKLKDEQIAENLGLDQKVKRGELTQDQVDYIGFGRPSKTIQRAEIKAANKKKKDERNQAIVTYLTENPSVTYKVVAELFGISERTINNIVKKYNIHRYEVVEKTGDEVFICATENQLERQEQTPSSEECEGAVLPFSAKTQKNALVSIGVDDIAKNNNILIYTPLNLADKLRQNSPREVNLSTKKRKTVWNNSPPDE